SLAPPLFPYTTLFRAQGLYGDTAGLGERAREGWRDGQRASGAPAQRALPERTEPRHGRRKAVARQLGGERRMRHVHHRHLAHGRSEEHTSELQSRENL